MSDDPVSMLSRDLYEVKIAARVLRIPESTLRWWLEGGERRGRLYAPVLRPESTGSSVMTWGELVEAGYLAGYRKGLRVRLWRLRDFVAMLRDELGAPYPLAIARPWVGPGRRLLLDVGERVGLDPELRPVLVEATTGQTLLSGLAERFVARVEFEPPGSDDAVVARLRPAGAESPVVIDPAVRFGMPSVRGIGTAVLSEKVKAGESLDAIADAYDLSVLDVAAAVSYEETDWPLMLTAA